MPVNSKFNWGDCVKKQQSRELIADAYKYLFGKSRIPYDRQYWTMCGKSSKYRYGEEGIIPKLAKGCEADQVFSSGLATIDQFHGVEKDDKIYKCNRDVNGVNWHHGDFYSSMEEYDGFNPSIINLDTLSMPKGASGYTSNICCLIAMMDIREVLIVQNVVLKCRGSSPHTHNDSIRLLSEQPKMISACFEAKKKGSQFEVLGNSCYKYNGTNSRNSNSGTIMGMTFIYRR